MITCSSQDVNNVKMVTGNAKLPNPPSLTDLTSKLDDFSDKIIAARSGDKVAIAERNAARLVVLDALRALAVYVQTTAANDVTVILSAGFEQTKTPVRHGVPGTPGDLRLSYNGKSGELIVRYKGVAGVRTFCIQVATSLEGVYLTQAPSTSTKAIVTGLTLGTVYFIRVAAVGTAGMGAFAGPAMIMAV